MVLTQLLRFISGKYLRTLNNKGEFKYYRDLIIRFLVTRVKIKQDTISLNWGLPHSLSSMLCSHRCRALTLNMATASYDVEEYPVY